MEILLRTKQQSSATKPTNRLPSSLSISRQAYEIFRQNIRFQVALFVIFKWHIFLESSMFCNELGCNQFITKPVIFIPRTIEPDATSAQRKIRIITQNLASIVYKPKCPIKLILSYLVFDEYCALHIEPSIFPFFSWNLSKLLSFRSQR